MGLQLGTADIGYDISGMQAVQQLIKAQVVDKAQQDMHIGLNTLRTEVDQAWQGTSAEKFKQNMETDSQLVSNALNESYNALSGELNTIINRMDEIDSNLVKERGQ